MSNTAIVISLIKSTIFTPTSLRRDIFSPLHKLNLCLEFWLSMVHPLSLVLDQSHFVSVVFQVLIWSRRSQKVVPLSCLSCRGLVLISRNSLAGLPCILRFIIRLHQAYFALSFGGSLFVNLSIMSLLTFWQ